MIMIDITMSIHFEGGHTYEGLFNGSKFRLECKYMGSKLICSDLMTESHVDRAELICMSRRCGHVDI